MENKHTQQVDFSHPNADKITSAVTNKAMNKEQAKTELIKLLENQVTDLVAMSKIELGDDVIAEIKRLKAIIKEG
jgi:tripartite-type tricarboxylate transporter receptor subunit TctC